MVQDGDDGHPGRRAGEDPARNHQDQGHHRRSAARGRTVRSPQAARDGRHHRNRRHREVRRGLARASARSTSSADNGTEKEYSLPRGVHINVQEGERVKAGEPLMDGPLQPARHSRRARRKGTAGYLVNEIQEVYRLQGVNINDKHIEVIVRQMMRWVKVEDVGDTRVPARRAGRQVPLPRRERARDRRRADVRQPAVRCCSASPRRRSRPTRSSRRHRSRRPRACSPKPPSAARWTTCAA